MFRSNRPKIGTALVLLSLALPLAAQDAKKAPAARPALTVTTVVPQAGDFPLQLEANGNVAAWQETIVGSEVGGQRLTDVRVNVGDVVKKGDTLAVFAVDAIDAE